MAYSCLRDTAETNWHNRMRGRSDLGNHNQADRLFVRIGEDVCKAGAKGDI
jgi:hypothetical protein